MQNPWSEAELLFLKENYPLHGGIFCSTSLNRDNKQVRCKANSLGLFSPKNKTKTTEEYLKDLLEAEIDIIPLEPYITNIKAILHEGYCGHRWKATPNRILSGRTGCPTCAKHGIDLTKPAKLYFISFIVDDIKYYKLGITNSKDISKRYLSEWNRLSMKVEWYKDFLTGELARLKEKELLLSNNNYKINTGKLNAGNTETLSVYIKEPTCKLKE